ncbi:PREDICTED: 2'-5'-oligoadenylate synthase 1 [Tinamus guttatus]|uniref:2'-5'-oligoadenylate synthase 1 n=1 Tax=Tinamus guttatus TaxID=94827 RepID=UPI00052E7928|nr:PREDICTED: 2'-5'-oligoadenylate synthase 1 [Tinamus guttatus]
MELYNTPSWQLDKFIQEELQPDSAFLEQLSVAVHTICEFLRETCFTGMPPPRTRVLKVIKKSVSFKENSQTVRGRIRACPRLPTPMETMDKDTVGSQQELSCSLQGGSAGKGTALRNSSDADLVMFLSCFKNYEDQEKNRAEIIREIQRRLLQCQQQERFEVEFEVNRWPNPRVLSFQLRSKRLPESVDFDVLPAYDALHHVVRDYKTDPMVYIRLFEQCTQGGEFSTCFTELQRDFISKRPTKVKSLIRLVKHWYKKVSGIRLPRATLPPQYALELLTVYAWEQGSGETKFSMAEAFRTVLDLLQHYEHLCIYWTINYDFEDITLSYYLSRQLRKSRPVILDPADPTNAVGAGSRWDLVAAEAKICCTQWCCLDVHGRPVQPWDVLLEQMPWQSQGVHTAPARILLEGVLRQTWTPGPEPAPAISTFPGAPHAEERASFCTVL